MLDWLDSSEAREEELTAGALSPRRDDDDLDEVRGIVLTREREERPVEFGLLVVVRHDDAHPREA